MLTSSSMCSPTDLEKMEMFGHHVLKIFYTTGTLGYVSKAGTKTVAKNNESGVVST
jgi:hypothetical protein